MKIFAVSHINSKQFTHMYIAMYLGNISSVQRCNWVTSIDPDDPLTHWLRSGDPDDDPDVTRIKT